MTSSILTVKDIIQFLEPNQIKIPTNSNTSLLDCNNFPSFVEEFITNYLPKDAQYYTCPPIGKNSFMTSFLYMSDPQFCNYRSHEREEAINELRKTMGYQLDEKDLHNKFNYTRKRKFKKVDLQKYLFQLTKSIEELYPEEMINNPINQYLVDFFSVNIFVINSTTKKIMPILANLDNPNSFKPTFFIFMESNLFYPLINHEQPFYLLSKHNFLNAIYEQFSKIKDTPSTVNGEQESEIEPVITTISEVSGDAVVEDTNESKTGEEDEEGKEDHNDESKNEVTIDLNKLTVKELQKMATDKGISIWKKSDKTAKNIFKKKQELIDNLSSCT